MVVHVGERVRFLGVYCSNLGKKNRMCRLGSGSGIPRSKFYVGLRYTRRGGVNNGKVGFGVRYKTDLITSPEDLLEKPRCEPWDVK